MNKKIMSVKVTKREIRKNKWMIQHAFFKTSPMSSRGIRFLMSIDAQYMKVHTVEISSLKK